MNIRTGSGTIEVRTGSSNIETRPPLTAIIRTVLDSSRSADPADAVDEVMAKISDADLRYYLRQAVSSRIASDAARERNKATPAIPTPSSSPARRVGLSTKQALIRDEFWPRFLQQRIFLPTGFKFLAKATAEDLRVAAEQRASQAQELLFRADQFTTLANVMDEHKVTFLEELDSKAGVRILERVA